MPSDEQLDKIARAWVSEAEDGYVWLCLLCGGVEGELNIRDRE